MKKLTLIYLCFSINIILQAQKITSFTPTSGTIGTVVNITGENFSTIPSENIVQVGTITAVVNSSSTTSINITIPAGIGSVVPISVTVNGKISYSENSITPYFTLKSNTFLDAYYASSKTIVGNNPNTIVSGDVNNDGKADILTADQLSNSISVLLGDGKGGFSSSDTIFLGSAPSSVTIGDFNGDSKSDVVTANYLNNSIMVCLGIGNGKFLTPTTINIGKEPQCVAVNDFNNDGNADIAVANGSDSTVSILLGNGNGTFSDTLNTLVQDTPVAISIADFNKDGKADIAVANYGSKSVSILLGKGNGTFNSANSILVDGTPNSVNIGDFNNDGHIDFATANGKFNSVSIVIGNGDGTFANASNITIEKYPSTTAIGDYNGDGKVDLAVAKYLDNSVSIYLGKGDGSFDLATNEPVGKYPWSLSAGDFNSDGKADLVIANTGENTVSILLNAPPLAPIANPVIEMDSTYFIASWNKVKSALSYIIDVATDSSFTSIISSYSNKNVANVESFKITGLTFGITYYYRVRAVNGNGISQNSNSISLKLLKGQVIIFNSLKTKTIFDLPYTISAVGGASGNPIIFSSSDTSIVKCTGINGTTISIIGAGSCIIYANQAGSLTYNKAITVAQTLIINPPKIFSITPISGPIGTPIVIKGIGFSSIPNDNIVVFGAIRANVISSTDSTITATIPQGAGSIVPFSIAIKGAVAYSVNSITPYFTITTTQNIIQSYSLTQINVGNAPQAVAIGDFNNDGKSDMVTANSGDTTVSIVEGNGDGTFVPFKNIGVGLSPSYVAIGDVNNDGNADIAVINHGLNILTGNGDGTFMPIKKIAMDKTPQFVTFGDFNNDGKTDIVTSNLFDTTLSIILGHGNGNFDSTINVSLGYSPLNITISDFNNDGISDITTANFPSNNVSILLGKGDGTFFPANKIELGDTPYSVAVCDFDNDGNSDIVTSCQLKKVFILYGKGNGTFDIVNCSDVGSDPEYVAVGDFNGDGNADFATANSGDYNISLLQGRGTHIFESPTTIGSTSHSINFAIGDFNGDGFADFASANWYSKTIGLWINSAKTTIPPVPHANQATSISPFGFTANWDKSISATGYYIDVASDSGFVNILSAYNNLDVKNTLTYNITNLVNNVTYFYRVRAYNSNGTSLQSNVIDAKTNDNVITFSSSSDSSISVIIQTSGTWTAISNVPWLTVSPASGTGADTIILTTTSNNGLARLGLVTITSSSSVSLKGAYIQTISVNQVAGSETAIAIEQSEKKGYHIIGNTVFFDNNETGVYTILGQRLSANGDKSITLQSGIYIVQTSNGSDKIVITNQ